MNRIMSLSKWMENSIRYGETKTIHLVGDRDDSPGFKWYEIIRGSIIFHVGSYDDHSTKTILPTQMPQGMYEYYNPVAFYAGGYISIPYQDMVNILQTSPDINETLVSGNGYYEFQHWSGVNICLWTIPALCRTNNSRIHSGLHCLYFSRELQDDEQNVCYVAFKFNYPESSNLKKKIDAAKNSITNMSHGQFTEVVYTRKVYM